MKLRLFAITLLLIASSLPARAANSPTLPSPWKSQDIGDVSLAGSAKAEKGVFTLKGTRDIWGVNDGCHFAWQTLRGDGAITARVLSVEQTQNHAKGGLSIRESLKAGSRHATMVVTPTDGTQFLSRVKANAVTTSQKTGLNKGVMPYWLKLERIGNQFTGYESTDGKNWIQTGTIALKLPPKIHIGLVASSHQEDILCAVPLDRVKVVKYSK